MLDNINPMKMFSSAFKEAQEILNDHSKLEAELNDLAANARACISSEEFRRYKKQYEEVEKKMLAIMIYDTNQATAAGMTMEQYGAVMFRNINKLMVLKSIIDVVEKDAKRGTSK